jgi:hypothetical protein
MSYIQDIKSLEHQHYLLAGLFFAATLAPGFLIIFHFKPELVEKYDFFKLLLFSMSFTVPYLLIHASQMAASGVFAGLGERDLKAGLGMACFASSHVLLVALLLTYFFGHSFKMFLIFMASWLHREGRSNLPLFFACKQITRQPALSVRVSRLYCTHIQCRWQSCGTTI